MHKKEILIGSSGVVAAIITRKVIQAIGIRNINLETKIFLLLAVLVVYSIKSVREKDKNVRKYSIISSISFFIFSIFLSFGMIIKESMPQYHQVIRMPLGIALFLIFVLNLIPLYAAKSFRE